jgi:hypothetical protein
VAVNETVLTLSLVGVAIYFFLLTLRDLRKYMRFRRLRRTAIVTWKRTPAGFRPLVMMGAINVLLVAVGVLNQRFRNVFGPLSIALYSMWVLPLLARIQVGFYGDGIWAEDGFVPYDRIRRLAFREGPDLVLLLLPRGRSGAFRLHVPPAEYGAVRRILGDKIRSQVMKLEGGILGL